jgi:hypothetical protein
VREFFKLKESGVESVDSGESTVILDEIGEQYFATNPAGSMLWNRLREGTTREDMVDALIERYEIDRSRAEQDVAAYITQLEEVNLLETTATDSAGAEGAGEPGDV